MKTQKKHILSVVFLTIGTIIFALSNAFAADSISQSDWQPTATWSGTGDVEVYTANSANYPNEEVGAIVTLVNEGTHVAPADLVDVFSQGEGKQDSEAFPTTTGEEINLSLYDSLTGFYDFGTIPSERTTPGVVTVKVPQTVGMQGEDILILQIDPVTGESYLIVPTAFDPVTGEMKVNFVNYGPWMAVSKLRLVDRVVDPDRYPNEEVTDTVKKLSATEYLTLKQFMNAQGITNGELSFEVPDDGTTTGSSDHVVYAAEEKKTRTVTVNMNEYQSVTLLSDVAVRLGVLDFDYDLTTKFKADLYQDLDRANWTKVLKYAGIKFDVNEVKKNPSLLLEIEPFVLKDAFVYHVDAATGETSIVYEPTISFDTYDEDVGDHIELKNNQDADSNKTSSLDELFSNKVYAEMKKVDKDKVSRFEVDDIDEDNSSNINMVISGDGYLGMGPFILVVHETSMVASLWWLWVLIALVVIGGIIWFVRKKKKA